MIKTSTLFILMLVSAGLHGQHFQKASIQPPVPAQHRVLPPSKAPSALILYEEDFETTSGGILPSGWTLDHQGSGNNWLLSDYTISLGTTSLFSFYSEHSARDAWAFSPGIQLQAGVVYTIRFQVSKPGDVELAQPDFLTVQIGQTPTSSGMQNADTLYIDTESHIANWIQITQTFTPSTTGTYYIGFHDFTPYEEGNYISIDDISVRTDESPLEHDLAISRVEASPYGFIPRAQTALPVSLGATADNIGTTTQTGITLHTKLNLSPETVLATNTSLTAGESLEMSGTTTINAVEGLNTLTYTVNSDFPDDDLSDNSDTVKFTGTVETYGADALSGSTVYPFEVGQGHMIGHIYEISKQTIVNQLYMAALLNKTSLAFDLFIYKLNGNSPVSEPVSQQTLTRPSIASTEGYYFLYFNIQPVKLPAGRYYVGIQQTSDNTQPLIVAHDNSGRPSWVKNGSELEHSSELGALICRLILPEENSSFQIPFGLAASNIKQTSATLTWRSDSLQQRIMIFETATGKQMSGYQEVVNTGVNIRILNVYGLNSGTDYTAQVFTVGNTLSASIPNSNRSALISVDFKTGVDSFNFSPSLTIPDRLENADSIVACVFNLSTCDMTASDTFQLKLEIDGPSGNWVIDTIRTGLTTAVSDSFETHFTNLSRDIFSIGGTYTLKFTATLSNPRGYIIDTTRDTTASITNVLPDLKLLSLLYPTSGNYYYNLDTEAITIQIQNTGSHKQAGGFSVNAQLNDEPEISLGHVKTENDSLDAGEIWEITFPNIMDLSAARTHHLRVNPAYVADLNKSNDTIAISFNHYRIKPDTILTPNSGTELGTAEDVIVRVVNLDTFALPAGQPIGLIINHLFTTTETLPAIKKYDTVLFKFDYPVNLEEKGLYTLGVYLAQDSHYQSIDTLSKIVKSTVPTVIDAELTEISTPVSKKFQTKTETVTVKVRNKGTERIENMPIFLIINNEQAVQEVIPAIEIGRDTTYTFTQKADLSADGMHTIQIFTQLAGDTNFKNDTLSKTVENISVIDLALNGFEISSDPSEAFQAVSVKQLTVCNNGTKTLTNVPIYFSANNSDPVMFVLDSILPESTRFLDANVLKTKLSLIVGNNTVKAYFSALPNDTSQSNDTVSVVQTTRLNLSVSGWLLPETGVNMGPESVGITLQNFSSNGISYAYKGLPIRLYHNNLLIATEIIDSVPYSESETASGLTFTFDQKADLQDVGEHNLRVSFNVPGNTGKQDSSITITNTICDLEILDITTFNDGAVYNNLGFETVAVRVKNNGSTTANTYELGYYLNGEGSVVQSAKAVDTIAAGEIKTFTFTTKLNLSASGEHVISAFVHTYTNDRTPSNDTAKISLTNHAYKDLKLSILQPNSGANLSESETVVVKVNNTAHAWNAQGVKMTLFVDNTYIADELFDVNSQTTKTVTFSQTINLSELGKTFNIMVYVDNEGDTVTKEVAHAMLIDLAIDSISVSTANTLTADSVPITLYIRNNSSVKIMDLPVYVSINGVEQILTTIDSINSESTRTITCLSTLALAPNSNTVETYFATTAGDTCISNDTARITVLNTIDLSVTGWLTPEISGTDLSDAETVTIKLQNNGTYLAKNIPILLIVNDDTVATEYIDSICVGNSYRIFTFAAKANLFANGLHTIKVHIDIQGNTGFSDSTIQVNNVWCAKTLPWTDDFSAATNALPPCWETVRTPETSGSNGIWHTGILPHIPPVSGHQYAMILANQAKHDAWLYTPGVMLDAGETYEISFWLMMEGTPERHEELDVKIGTAKNESEMTTVLYTNHTTDISTWTKISKTFTSAVSGLYYIGFQATAQNAKIIAIDAVSVRHQNTIPENDLEIVGMPFTYTQIPVSQLVVSSKALNSGKLAQANVKLSAMINGTPVGTSNPVTSLAPGEISATLKPLKTGSIPVGNTMLVCTVSSDSNDENPANNSKTFTYTATENTYACDTVTVSGTSKISGGTAVYGHIFEISNETWLSAITVCFASSAVADYSVSIYRMTDELTVVDSALATQTATRNATGFTTVNMPKILLESGRYFACINWLDNSAPAICHDGNANGGFYTKDGNKLKFTYLQESEIVGSIALRMVIDDLYTPFTDIALTEILLPDVDSGENMTLLPVCIVLKNNGETNVSACPLNVFVNDRLVLTESMDTNLLPGNQTSFTFTNWIDVSENGRYDIRIVASLAGDVNNANDTLRKTVTNIITSAVQTAQNRSSTDVYPNPADHTLFIHTSEIIKQLEIYTLQGNLLKRISKNTKEVNVTDLKSGAYVLKITTENAIIVRKFIVDGK